MVKRIVGSIPNALTMGNLICGCIAIVFAFKGEFHYAFWAIIAAAGFDFLDGFAARLLKAYSPLGAQLDSLCDMVSFGVAPAMIFMNFHAPTVEIEWVAIISSLIFPICAALRLAKFNISTDQSDKFIGLPSPAAALFLVSYTFTGGVFDYITTIPLFVVSFLMVANLEMFALKFKTFGFKANAEKYVFLILAVIAVVIFGVYVVPCVIILLYILMSLVLRAVVKR